MTLLEHFLGQDLEIPEDRLYSPGHHLWLRRVDSSGDAATLEVGVTGPGVALTGGLVELDVLVDEGQELVVDEEVAFATTRKAIKYFLSPLRGTVTARNDAASAETGNTDPYGTWWFRATIAAGWDASFLDAAAYAAKLAATEHATDAAAAAAAAAKQGKASPTCRSVYSGIKE